MTTQLADGWIASDQTGAFPRVSNRGNKYICVFYIFDANFIKGIPIKSRHRSELLKAYTQVYKWCEARGFKPSLHRMDNERSQDVEAFITSQGADVQYTPRGAIANLQNGRSKLTRHASSRSPRPSPPNSQSPIGAAC